MTGNLYVSQYEGLVEWVVIDFTPYGGQQYRIVNSSLPDSEPVGAFFGNVSWQGESWTAVPLESASWRKGEKSDKPRIVIPDVESLISTTFDTYDGAPGIQITRYKSLGLGVPLSTERYTLAKHQSVPGFKVTLELTHVLDTNTSVPSYRMKRADYPGLGPAIQR